MSHAILPIRRRSNRSRNEPEYLARDEAASITPAADVVPYSPAQAAPNPMSNPEATRPRTATHASPTRPNSHEIYGVKSTG